MAASMATRKRNTSARYVTHYAIFRAMLTLQLLYIYILGWNVDFGHLEAVNLISATKYSEKQIGYLAVTLFLHEEHELIHLVVNSIRKDLLDHNELNNCLALHAIANVGGKELGEALSAEVHRLLISPLAVIEQGQWLS
jgi:AP-2 complex subunit alpha